MVVCSMMPGVNRFQEKVRDIVFVAHFTAENRKFLKAFSPVPYGYIPSKRAFCLLYPSKATLMGSERAILYSQRLRPHHLPCTKGRIFHPKPLPGCPRGMSRESAFPPPALPVWQ